jgi:ABC-type uncharacterized transport system permease subunit
MITLSLIQVTLGMAVRMSTPYLYAGLGGMISQHNGVYNFALEGMMLGGAFFGYYFTWLTGSLLVGTLGAMLCGAVFGFIMSFIMIRFGVSQMVLGLGINTLFLGITSFFTRLMNMDPTADLRVTRQIGDTFSGKIAEIPILGELILKQNVMTYAVILLYIAYAWFLKRTRHGLAMRSVGENPAAAQSAGINVFRYRYFWVTVSSVLASLGGAYLTLTQVNRFAENMTNGRGWIAIAALCLGRLSPLGVFLSCLLFGLATALSNQIQVLNVGIPYQYALMIPYVLALLALISMKNQTSQGPAALGKPYMKNR